MTFAEKCREFNEQAQEVMDYDGAFDKCLNFLCKYKTPALSMQLMFKYVRGKMIANLHKIKWPVDDVNIEVLAAKMFVHFTKKEEFEKCARLQNALEQAKEIEPSEAFLHDFCYRVHVIYCFSANCQVMWEEYDGHQGWGIFNTGMFSFDCERKLSGTDIDGIEFVTVLLNHFRDIDKHDARIDLKALLDQLLLENEYYKGKPFGTEVT